MAATIPHPVPKAGRTSTWTCLLVLAGLSSLLHPTSAAADAPPAAAITLTETELRSYDGTDPSKPIYLALNTTIYDVSASPSFYGPGGHYHHFVGQDATRAWITECWDETSQFTWRLDDVHLMFMPKYLDELLMDVGDGDFDNGGLGELEVVAREKLKGMAEKALERLGPVRPKARANRRVKDREEADERVRETLAHWVRFFENNPKYAAVGSVVLDESKPAPPPPCSKAMEKRPLKGGKLEGLMGSMGNIAGGGAGGAAAAAAGMGGAAAAVHEAARKGEMPAAVREQIEKAKKQAVDVKDGVEDVKQTVKDTAADAAEVLKDTAESATDDASKTSKIVTDAAASATDIVKDAAVHATTSVADVAETVKQKASEAATAVADTVEDLTSEAGKKATAAGESYESVAQKAHDVKDEAVKQAAEAVAAGADTVKQKAEEVKANHDEL